MIAVLIGKNSINKITLPQTVLGNYWLTDENNKEVKLINIEGKNGKWQVVSNNNIKIIAPKSVIINNDDICINWNDAKIMDKVTLYEYNKYFITFGNSKQCFVLYCLPGYESNIFHLDIKNTTEITIGRNSDNDISYNDNLIAEKHAKISFINQKWIVENFDNKFGTFVNNKPVDGRGTRLFNGDVIFIMGFKLIIIGKSIFINIPQNKIICNNEVFSLNRKK